MRRYLVPLLLFAPTLLGLIASWNHEFAWVIFLGAYFVQTVWWVVLAVRAPPMGRHLAAVFAPALLPLCLVGFAALAMRETDAAVIAIFSLLPFIAGVLLVTVIGAVGIALGMSSATRKGGVEF